MDGAACIQGECVACASQTSTVFDALGNWATRNNAALDAGSIRLTSDVGDQRGQLVNLTDHIGEGGVSIKFRFQISNNSPEGEVADGLAFTIVDVDPATFNAISPNFQAGGGLGYAYTPPAGTPHPKAVTVEVDTYYNGVGEGAGIPAFAEHIAVARDLDPNDIVAFWSPPEQVPQVNCPSLGAADGQRHCLESVTTHMGQPAEWHELEVQITTSSIRILLDDELKVEQNDGFVFRGGYMFFSAGTGFWHAEHRIDDVRVTHGCPRL